MVHTTLSLKAVFEHEVREHSQYVAQMVYHGGIGLVMLQFSLPSHLPCTTLAYVFCPCVFDMVLLLSWRPCVTCGSEPASNAPASPTQRHGPTPNTTRLVTVIVSRMKDETCVEPFEARLGPGTFLDALGLPSDVLKVKSGWLLSKRFP